MAATVVPQEPAPRTVTFMMWPLLRRRTVASGHPPVGIGRTRGWGRTIGALGHGTHPRSPPQPEGTAWHPTTEERPPGATSRAPTTVPSSHEDLRQRGRPGPGAVGCRAGGGGTSLRPAGRKTRGR